MKIPSIISAALACVLATAVGPLLAAESGDAATGAKKNSMCQGCHGIPGYKTVFPEVYSVPKLGGQYAAYIVKALQEYKSGNRGHPTMRAIAAGLTDKDMADLAAHYGVEAPKTGAK